MGCVLEVIGLYTLLLKTIEKVSNIMKIQDIEKLKYKADYIFQMSKLTNNRLFKYLADIQIPKLSFNNRLKIS